MLVENYHQFPSALNFGSLPQFFAPLRWQQTKRRGEIEFLKSFPPTCSSPSRTVPSEPTLNASPPRSATFEFDSADTCSLLVFVHTARKALTEKHASPPRKPLQRRCSAPRETQATSHRLAQILSSSQLLFVGLRAYAGDRYQKFCCGAPGARRPGGSHRRPSAVACSPPREGSA